ncbi:MAG: hypothetical protein WA690_03160 [Candidatus Acidiferrales bacterium]
MIFTVLCSTDPADNFAPYRIELDGAPFLTGIEVEAEAHDICRLLIGWEAQQSAYPQAVPPAESSNIIPMRPRFVPKMIERWKRKHTRKLASEHHKT